MKYFKKIVLGLLLSLTLSNLSAQELSTAKELRTSAREQRYKIEGKENYIFATFSMGLSSHQQMLLISKIEYSRQIKDNFFWGVTMQYNEDTTDGFMRDYARQDIFTLNGMAYYRVPVIKERLFLRPGLGFGLGYHSITNHTDNPSESMEKVLPYFNAELTWLLRVSKHIDLKFSPTILLLPQSFSISPVKFGYGFPMDATPYHFDIGFNVGVGVRF